MIATVTIGFIVTVAIVLLNLYVDVVQNLHYSVRWHTYFHEKSWYIWLCSWVIFSLQVSKFYIPAGGTYIPWAGIYVPRRGMYVPAHGI